MIASFEPARGAMHVENNILYCKNIDWKNALKRWQENAIGATTYERVFPVLLNIYTSNGAVARDGNPSLLTYSMIDKNGPPLGALRDGDCATFCWRLMKHTREQDQRLRQHQRSGLNRSTIFPAS